MNIDVKKSTFLSFLSFCNVKGKQGDGSQIEYFQSIVIEANEGEIRCTHMHRSGNLYIDITMAATVHTEGTISFRVKDMVSAIEDLEGETINVKKENLSIRAGDGNEYSFIPALDASPEQNDTYKRGLAFRPRFDWDEENIYFVLPKKIAEKNKRNENMSYKNIITTNAQDLLKKMKRLSFLDSIYYHFYTEDNKLGIELINAKKKGRGKKFRWLNLTDVVGKFDVEFKEAIHPVINTIGSGQILIYDMNDKDISNIPSVVFHEYNDVQAFYAVTQKISTNDESKKS